MRILGRPLAVCSAVFMISCAAGYLLSEYCVIISTAVGALSLLSVLLFAVFENKTYRRAALIVAFSSLLSVAGILVSYVSLVQSEKETSVYYNREVTITAYCTSVVSRSSYNAKYTVDALTADGREESFGLLLITSGDVLEVGDVFGARVMMRALADGSEGFDEHSAYGGRGVVAAAEVCDGTSLSIMKEKKEVLRFFDKMRNAVTDRFDSFLDDRSASYFSAVFAGDRSFMADADALSVRRSGTSHLLAVSGMHFSVVMGAAYFFVRSIGLRIRSRYAVLALVAFVYAGLTGFSAPVVRSGAMLLLTYLGASLGKRSDALTSLLCVGALMLAVRPYYLLSASYWLSFSATLGVVLFSPVTEEIFARRHRPRLADILGNQEYSVWRRVCTFVCAITREGVGSIPELLIGSVMVSIAASAFSMPFCMLFFGSVSYSSIPAGIMLSPVVSVSLLLSPVILSLGSLSPVSAIGNLLGKAFFTITHFFSDIDGVYVNVNYTTVKVSLFVLLLTALIVMLFTSRKLLPLAVCTLAVVSVFSISHISENVEFDDIRAVADCSGDSNFVALRTDSGLVIADMGSNGANDIDRSTSASSALKENEIAAYIFTDVSNRQEGVVRYLLANHSVGCVYLPDYAAHAKSVIVDAARLEAERAGVSVKYFRFGEEFTVGEYTFCVSELEFLERSVRPLYSVGVSSDEGSLLWVSGAYFEGEKSKVLDGAYFDRIIFGSYGPKYKENIPDVYDLVECSEYIAGSREIEEFVRPEKGKGKNVPFLVNECVKFGFSTGNTKKIP